MKLKDTIYHPKTSFSMRANASEKELAFINRWKKLNLYQKLLNQNKENKKFFLHHGPPYANGRIHIGHSLNAILKEFVQRIKLQDSFYAPMMFGWDTHGLPIEHALLKRNKDLSKLDVVEFRKKCRIYAMEQANIQMEDFIRLGLIIDFENNYYTMSKAYESFQIELFYKFLINGYIYRANKPIIWSWSSRSALADAEVEYKDVESPSVYLLAKIINYKKTNDIYALLWTTTPWTLPSNQAIAYSRKFKYIIAISSVTQRKILLSNEAFERLKSELKLSYYDKITINALSTLKYISPITKIISPFVEGHHLEKKQGSGIVHIAPGHGKDDYLVGIKNNLRIISGVDEKGLLTDKKYQGIFYTKANIIILKDLEKDGLLLLSKMIKHSYPMDWRTGKPVIFRATTQWFINVNKIKPLLIKHINSVNWLQKWAQKRMIEMIVNRDDWCISRQRRWGVPIAIYYDKENQPIINLEIFEKTKKLFSKYGSDIYYEKSFEKKLSFNNANIKKVLANVSKKELDIMDVWLDSGISHYAVMWKKFGIKQSDLYLEGTDQFRGWFNSSLITSCMLNNNPPYKQVITHGFIVDKDGKKMSKSKGNGIPLSQLIKKYGADVIRLFFANSDYNDDIRVSIDTFEQVVSQYRKIRNVFRFLLANLNSFTKKIDISNLNKIDKYILYQLNALIVYVKKSYEEYNFKSAIKAFNNFIITYLSSLYFEIAKDTLYIKSPENIRKQQIQSVFEIILDTLMILVAPILPFLTEDVYLHSSLYKAYQIESVHLLKSPSIIQSTLLDNKTISSINDLLVLKADLNHVIDEEIKKGRCKKVSEVQCIIHKQDFFKIFSKDEMKEIIQTSDVIQGDINNKKSFSIKINKKLIKCDRCWTYHKNVRIYKRKENSYSICKNCEYILEKYFKDWE